MAYAPLYKQLFRENVTRNYIAIVDKLLWKHRQWNRMQCNINHSYRML